MVPEEVVLVEQRVEPGDLTARDQAHLEGLTAVEGLGPW